MKAKSLLLASVVGAVAVGGVLTGATVAAWRDSAPVDAGVLRTGDLSLSTSLSTTTVAPLEPGEKAYATLTLDARGEGKNLRTVTTIDSVDGFTANGPLTVRFRPKEAGSGQCSELAAADGWEPWNGTPLQLTDPIFPTLTKACVEIAAKPATGVPLGTATFPLSITASLRQVVDGSPAGWSASAPLQPLTVTVKRDLTAPVVRCWGGPVSVHLAWEAVPGASEYRVYRLRRDKAEPVGEATTETQATIFPTGLSPTYVVRAYATGTDSAESNQVKATWYVLFWGCG
ncbi:hypothetical protein [Nocardioides pakistanensis]